jgi:hypothetical protein
LKPSKRFNFLLEAIKNNNNNKLNTSKENNKIKWASLQGLPKNQITKDENDKILKCNIK